jgi:large subunit ribosomal protein L25
MEKFMLTIEDRTELGHKVRHLRREGIIPGVVYGEGKPARPIQTEARSLERLLARGGASHIVDLEGAGMPKTRVLIREVQRDPVRRTVQHIDFVRVAAGTRIRMAVPLVLVGEAPVIETGAIVLQNADTIEIECLPDDLPAQIEVDISGLATIHDRVATRDVVLPKGVKLLHEQEDESLVTVTVPRAVIQAEEEEEEEEMLLVEAEPELVGRRPAEEEEEE